MKKIASALKELEDHEYLCRERKCSEDTGRVIDWVYTVSDEKLPENILRNSFRRKNPNMKETVTDCSEKITPESHYPHIHNADVAESHMEYPHEENPHI